MAAGDITEFTKSLTPIFNELRNAARSLSNASEKLSNNGLDKLTNEVKKTLKQQGLINDLDADQIKNAKTLNKVLDKLEDQYEQMLKLERKAQQIAEQSLKDNYKGKKASAEVHAQALKAARESLSAKYDELDLTEDMVQALKKGIPAIRDEIEARTRLIGKTDALAKEYDGLKDKVSSQVRGFASLATATALLQKSFSISYDQANRMTQRGMLGAFMTINLLAPRLLISAKELEDIMTTNRDLVNSLGGGIKGIEALGSEISRVRSEVKYLGVEATKAAARFVEMSKKSGLTPKDGKLYRQNLDKSIQQFKEFSGLFGDSYEDYAALMEQMQEEESIRNRLNTLSKDRLALELDEIRKRTENLKLMGLSNNQIVEFNKTISNIRNPKKNDFSERAIQSLGLKSSANEMARLLSGSGNADDQRALADLQSNQAGIARIANLTASNDAGSKKQLEAYLQSPEGLKAIRAYQAAVTRTNDFNAFDIGARNKYIEMSGNLGSSLESEGSKLNDAKQKDRDLSGRTPEELAAIKKQNEEMVASNGKLAEALNAAVYAVEGVKRLFENPLLLAAAGVAAGMLAVAGAAIAAAKALGRLALSGLGGIGKMGRRGARAARGAGIRGGLAAGAIGGGLALWELSDEQDKLKNGEISKSEFDRNAAGIVGGTAGGWAGAAIGAGIGSAIFPGVGTVIGGLAGGALGYFGGSAAGSGLMGMYGNNTSSGSRQSSGKVSGAVSTPASVNSNSPIVGVVSASQGVTVVKKMDGSTETRKGTRAWRNNNPGNIEYGQFAIANGAVGTDGRFAVFPTLEAGRKAKENLIFQGKNYKDLDLKSAISRYAPSFENDTGRYQSTILAAVGGVNKRMGDYSPEERSRILDAMQKHEGFKPGTAISSAPFTGSSTVAAVTPRMLDNEIAANSSAAMPTSVAAASTSSDPNEELKKQTNLLYQIAQNTTNSGRLSARPDSYMHDPAATMTASPG